MDPTGRFAPLATRVRSSCVHAYWRWVTVPQARKKRRRERKQTLALANELRGAARILDAKMQSKGMTRAQRRAIFRSCASAGSFAEVFDTLNRESR